MAAKRLDASAKVLGAASGFTSVWALAWFGAHFGGAGTAVAGGFAVGGVMAGSGLTLLWWRVSAMRALAGPPQERAPAPAEDTPPAPR